MLATRQITAPFTGEPLAELDISGGDEVRAAYDRARQAQARWAKLPVTERVKPFLRLHDAILNRRDEILDIVQNETGKARKHAFEEVLDVAGCALHYARRAPGCSRRRAGAASSPSPPRSARCASPRAWSR